MIQPEDLTELKLLSQRPESRVYQAQRPDGEWVVYKQFLFQQAQNWKQYELFERESEALKALKHPLIPRILAHGSNEDGPWQINQWMPGQTLSEKLDAGWHPTEAEIRSILEQALEILDWLHERHPPIVHRDIKPSNLVLSDEGKVSLIDFGSVLLKWQQDGGSTVAGTFGYMAPEQLTGRSGPTSDLYSLGATAVRLLTGKEPAELPQERLSIRFEDHCDCSPQLKKVIRKLLAPIPEDRFESAHQALSILRNMLNVVPHKPTVISVQKMLNHLPELPEPQAEDTGLEVSYSSQEVCVMIPACGFKKAALQTYARDRGYFISYIGLFALLSNPMLKAFHPLAFLGLINVMICLEWLLALRFTRTITYLHFRENQLLIEKLIGNRQTFKSIDIADITGTEPNRSGGRDLSLFASSETSPISGQQRPIKIGQNLSSAEQDWLCNLILLWRSQAN